MNNFWGYLEELVAQSIIIIDRPKGSVHPRYPQIVYKLDADIYFTDSYAAWQKGAIENANKLIRQYIPKGLDFNVITDDFIKQIQHKINRRPRLKLNFSSPNKLFFFHFY